MAAINDMTENLSKNLTVNDNDIKSLVCDEELDTGCKSSRETDTENIDLKSEERTENEELFNRKQEEGKKNCQESTETDEDFKDCNNSEFRNNSDCSERQSISSRTATSSKGVDEALLEDDEDNIELSDDGEENYESAEEEHLTPEEAEVITVLQRLYIILLKSKFS